MITPNTRVPGAERDGGTITLSGAAATVAQYGLMETRMRCEDTWLAGVLDDACPTGRGPQRSDHLALVRWCAYQRARGGDLMASALVATLDALLDEIHDVHPDAGYEIHVTLWELEAMADREEAL